MKRLTLFAALAAFTSFIGSGGVHAGEALDRIMERGKMVLALDADYPPFSFLNDQGQMDGFDIDVAREFAKRLGVELEVVTPAWEVITAGNWAGRWDICIGSMTPTKARAEVLDFPILYYWTPSTVVVHKDNTSIKGPGDLTGKRVGVQSATTYENYLQKSLVIDAVDVPPVEYKIEDAEIVPYESEPLAFEDLSLGDGVRLDAMVTGLLTALEQVKAGKPVKPVGDPLFQEPIAVAIDKGDPELADKVVEIITAMREDGTLSKLSEKWIGADVSRPPS